MQSSSNRAAGVQEYAAKRPLYEQSNFEITKKIAQDHTEWSPEQIAARQRWMARQATVIWRIAQLS